MKLRSCLLATLAVATFGTTTFADNPFDKFIPRGRLLRKLRDDIVGPPKPQKSTPAAKSKGANQKGPTPAVRPQGQPTLAVGNQPRPGNQAARPATQKQSATTGGRSNGNALKGFGMSLVADKKDNIVVAKVVPGGNAAQAGVKQGDVIVEAGGVKLTSVEEYEEIRKVLGAGDQLEVKLARRGREATLTLQHGQPPTLEDMQVTNPSKAPGLASPATTAAGETNQYRSYSFVPPADEDSRPGMRSVVERPITPVRPASTQQRAMGQLRSNARPTQPQPLQQTVTEQQRQIQLLQQQLDQLRRQQGPTGSGVRQRRGR